MFLTNVNEEYLKTINNMDLLQEMLVEKQKENQKQIFLKKYEINRLIEEQKYILDEIEMQKSILTKNEKFCKKIIYKYKKLEFKLTGLLIHLFKIKEDFLMKRVVFHSLKSEFDRIYRQNQENLGKILKREEQIEGIKEEIVNFKTDKEQSLVTLSEKVKEKEEKSNVVNFNEKINDEILELNKILFKMKEDYEVIRNEKEKGNIKLKILIKKFNENKTRLLEEALKLKKEKLGTKVQLKQELVKEIAKKIFYIRKNRKIEQDMKQLNLQKIQNTNQRIENVFSDQLFQLFVLKNKIKTRRQIWEQQKKDFEEKKKEEEGEEENEGEGEEKKGGEKDLFKDKIENKLNTDRFAKNDDYLRTILEFSHTAKLEDLFMKQMKKVRGTSVVSGGEDDLDMTDQQLKPIRQNVKLNFINDLKEKLSNNAGQ